MRRRAFVVALALCCSLAQRSSALSWPDVADRVERGLAANEPGTRRIAAQELPALGVARATPLVVRALSDVDVEVRLLAAQAALRLRLAMGSADVVIAWLGEPEPRLRAAACEVLRVHPVPDAAHALARALGDADPAVRAAAADALAMQSAKDAVPALLGRLDDPSVLVRVRIIRALGRIGDRRAVVPIVGKARDSSVEVRQTVAAALGALGDLAATPALLLGLRDTATEVRVEAIASLGKLRAALAVDALSPLVSDRTPAVRHAVIATLARIASDAAVRALTSALGAFDDANAGYERSTVRDALVTVGPRAIPALAALLRGGPSASVASSAAWVLGALRARSESTLVVEALRRGVLGTGPAIHALGSLGDRAALSLVLEFLDDPSAEVRAQAVRAASELLDPAKPDGRAVEPIAAALVNPRIAVAERAALAELLGRTGAPRAAVVLRGLVEDADRSVAGAAVAALGALGPTDSDTWLLRPLSRSDASLRFAAALALASSGGVAARDALLAALDGGSELDRVAVLTALAGILSRVANDASTVRLFRALEFSVGGERDAIIAALARASSARATELLGPVAASADDDDRRGVAATLDAAGSRGAPLLRRLLGDRDARVRAQAAYGLGAVGDVDDAKRLAVLVAEGGDVAINAIAALGLIAERTPRPGLAAALLCPHLGDARPEVRANALTGLALAQARCADGSAERALLRSDAHPIVRAAAGRALRATRLGDDDDRALERCASEDHSGDVAARCAESPVTRAPSRRRAVEVHVVPGRASVPEPRAPYLLERGDGLLRAGTADRRGVVFEAYAPEGMLRLPHVDRSPH